MPGFISNLVLGPVNEGDPYIVFTIWKSRQDFLNWVRSNAFVQGHAQSGSLPTEAFSQSNVLEMHEVVQDSNHLLTQLAGPNHHRLAGMVSSSNVEYVNFALFDSKQYTITAHNHLANLLREFVVLGRQWKAFRSDAELFNNGRS